MALNAAEVSELGIGMLSLFGGLLSKIAPPERLAMIWTGIASLIAALMFLAVKLLGLMSLDGSSKVLWGIIAFGSIIVSLLSCWIYVMSLQKRTVPYSKTVLVAGTAYTSKADTYRTEHPGETDEDIVFAFAGHTTKVWTEETLRKSRYILGLEYSIFVACLAFGLNLSLEVLNHEWSTPIAKADPTIDQMASELKDVHFDYRLSALGQDAREKVSEDAAVLTKILNMNSSVNVVIEGHADDRGSDAYNLKLGFERASAIQQELVRLGLPSNRVRPSSAGKQSPLCTEPDDSCRARNRRVHFTVGT